MRFLTIAAVILSSTLSKGLVGATTLKYDSHYSIPTNLQLTAFACSDGPNGLITKYGVSTVAQLQTKLQPNTVIAATPFIAGWNSPQCGSCYQARNPQNNKSIKFVGVDKAGAGIVVTGPVAFSTLSRSGSTAEGSFLVYITQLPLKDCIK